LGGFRTDGVRDGENGQRTSLLDEIDRRAPESRGTLRGGVQRGPRRDGQLRQKIRTTGCEGAPVYHGAYPATGEGLEPGRGRNGQVSVQRAGEERARHGVLGIALDGCREL